jgi:DNA processing protein
MSREACERCLERTWLLSRLSGHLDVQRRQIQPLLALGNDELIAAVGGSAQAEVRAELDSFEPDRARSRAADAGLELICRCEKDYPARLLELEAPPAVLHVAGGVQRLLALCDGEPVGLVGSRRASEYGLEVARTLGRGVAGAGLTVISGMAAGIDCAAHQGALGSTGATVAVLPCSAERPYPFSKRTLHRSIVASGVALSELAPGSEIRRWGFVARNRIIAALSPITVVVEAGARSGSLVTARIARSLGRIVGAVPGRVTSPQAIGPNELLAGGAQLIRGPEDVLEALFGPEGRTRAVESRLVVPAELQDLLATIAGGCDTLAALSASGTSPAQTLSALAELELAGYVRRGSGGRYLVIP